MNSTFSNRLKSDVVTEALQNERGSGIRLGFAQDIGNRTSQQDSAGATSTGELAVLADGMGGMTGGDIVSSLVVKTILDLGNSIGPNPNIVSLLQILQKTNCVVNDTLGPDKIYQCGSTMVCSLIKNRWLLWASVGDSRVYLLRGGGLIQLNREHNVLHKQLTQAVQGIVPFQAISSNPNAASLTSFFGMGNLAAIDFAAEPIHLCKGDWVLLMSDGVFHFLSEEELLQCLYEKNDPQAACERVIQLSRTRNHPYQDNISIVIQGV